jgi:hypothetical protein
MTIQELSEKSSHRIFIPSKTKDGTPIPQEERSRHIRQIMARCSDVNGGGTIFHNVEGFFRLRDGTIMLEGNSVIETAGRKPLSNEEVEVLAKELKQESILIQEMGACRSIFVSGEIEELTGPLEVTSTNGARSVFHREDRADGEVRYVREDYDEAGTLIGVESLTETEMAADEEESEPRDERAYEALESQE